MKKIIVCNILLAAVFCLNAQTFRFSQQEGSEYRIVSEVEEGVFLNDNLLGESRILNRIGVLVDQADETGAMLQVQYGISEQSLDTGLYVFSMEDKVQFYRSSLGEYSSIPAEQYLPSVRNVPVFPEDEVSSGETWNGMAEEVHDLQPFFGIDYRLHIPFRVFYTYQGTETFRERTVDVIRISYHYLTDLDPLSLPPGSLREGGADLPIGVSGDFSQLYYWDSQAGIPAFVTEDFSITYMMASGDRYVFKGRAEGEVIEADQWEKESVKDQIREAIEDQQLEDISVEVNDEGVVLTLDNIHFYPDRAVFLPGEEGKLEELGKIIASFPGHDLLITGHTAYVGPHRDGIALSEKRAAAVAAFFLKKGIKDSSHMVVQGLGSTDPVADNDTEEGKKKNRRVEITILDN